MADGIGSVPLSSGVGALPATAAPASQPTVELAQPPPAALLAAATLAAVVLGRGGNGALLLRTDYGTLALKTPLALPVDSRVDIRLLPGPPPAAMLLRIEQPPAALRAPPPMPGTPAPPSNGSGSAKQSASPASAALAPPDEPPAQLDLGTEIEATLLSVPTEAPTPAATAALVPGTRFALRIALPALAASLPSAPPAPSQPQPAPAPGASPAALRLPPAATPGTPPTPAAPSATTPTARLLATMPAALPLRVPDAASDGRSAAAATFTGTVIASPPDFADRTLLETPVGTLALDRRMALPTGTMLSVTRLAVLPPAAAPNPIEHATVLQATVVAAPADPAQGAPPGTRLVLRVAAAPAAPAAPAGPMATTPADNDGESISGTVIAASGGETMVETPLGTLAFDRRLALPPGALLRLQRLGASLPTAPANPPLAQSTSWPALNEALPVLDRIAPDLAARLRSDLTPATGPQLAGTLLFLMDALSAGTWPGSKMTSALASAGRRDLGLRLDRDVGEIRRLANPPTGDWRIYVLPVFDEASVRPVRLYLRRRSGGGPGDKEGARFVLDVDTSRLGAFQIDGLVRHKRFDVALRSHQPLTAEMRQDIATLFHNALSASGLAGDILFTTASRFAVAPLEALRTPVGIDA